MNTAGMSPTEIKQALAYYKKQRKAAEIRGGATEPYDAIIKQLQAVAKGVSK